MYPLANEVPDVSTFQGWVGIIVIILGTVLGGGGVGAIMKARSDRQNGVAQSGTAEDNALVQRWQNLIETQTKILLEPLQSKVSSLETEVSNLKSELSATHQKYWAAITYIRQLLLWFDKHLPDGLGDTQIPPPPTRLTDDL